MPDASVMLLIFGLSPSQFAVSPWLGRLTSLGTKNRLGRYEMLIRLRFGSLISSMLPVTPSVPRLSSVNQMLPSAPGVMPPGLLLELGIGVPDTNAAVVSNCITSLF